MLKKFACGAITIKNKLKSNISKSSKLGHLEPENARIGTRPNWDTSGNTLKKPMILFGDNLSPSDFGAVERSCVHGKGTSMKPKLDPGKKPTVSRLVTIT